MRVRLQPKLQVLVVILLLTGLAAGTWLLWQRSNPISLAAATPSSAPATAVEPPVKKLWVDVAGEVAKPGVYQLDPGARVEDAIAAAGGATAKVDWASFALSRAALVEDSQKIVVPGQTAVEPAVSPSSASSKTSSTTAAPKTTTPKSTPPPTTGCVNLNTASAAALDALPGIGTVRVQKIQQARPFASINELTTKKLIPVSVFSQIKDKLCLL